MKKIDRKKLNNKGFTLVELLAVVVILAVVIGIAMTNVLSSMNKARGGSLEDSAITIAQAFNTKYTESLVGGNPTAVYSDAAGVTNFKGYNFTTDARYELSVGLRNTFNLSYDAYVFSESSTTDAAAKAMNVTSNAVSNIEKSFVAFDSNTASFLVCLVAKDTGSYYVNNYTVGNANNSGSPIGVVFDGVTYKFKTNVMFACSNGVTSWKKTSDTSLFVTS